MEQKVQLDAKKTRMYVYANYERQEDMRTTYRYFRRKLNIPISHNGEMIEFLKFQGKLLFSDFCSGIFSFCQPLCPASGVQF